MFGNMCVNQAIVQAANIDDARELCMDWMKMQNSYPQNKGEFRIDFIASEDPALVGQEQIWHNPTKEVKKVCKHGPTAQDTVYICRKSQSSTSGWI